MSITGGPVVQRQEVAEAWAGARAGVAHEPNSSREGSFGASLSPGGFGWFPTEEWR